MTAAGVVLTAAVIFSLISLIGRTSDDLLEYEAIGYEVHELADGNTSFETSGIVSLDQNRQKVSLKDDTAVEIMGIGEMGSIELSLERRSNSLNFDQDDIETTGSKRVVRLSEVEFNGGEEEFFELGMVVTLPAAEKGEVNIDTINIARIGPVIEDGVIIPDAVRYLPASIDEDGNIRSNDIYLTDSLISKYLMEESSENSLRSVGAGNLLLNITGMVSINEEETNQEEVEITYTAITFQNSINWNRRPQLIRMVPDKEMDNLRTPIDRVSDEEKEKEMKKPVHNVIVFVHGRNEAEKSGIALNDIGAPWFYSYKRDVWTHMYKGFMEEYEEKMDCTIFYEFIYPTFRPIISPVRGELDRTTLDIDFNRSLEMALREQLDNDLEFNLIIVAHSMGGVVARAGVQHFNDKLDASFKTLVTWGTPHLGSPLVTLRYVLGEVPLWYRIRNVPSTHMFFDLRRIMDDFTIDTPGTRDLRWDGGPVGSPYELSLSQYFRLSFEEEKYPDLVPIYNLNDGEYVMNHNLRTLNKNDRYRNHDKYIFMYGITEKTAISRGYRTITVPGTGQEVVIPFPEADAGEIALGATVMEYLFKEPNTLYDGREIYRGDGAVPLPSMAGGSLNGNHIYLGDIDHEEYFGTPLGSKGYPYAFSGVLHDRESSKDKAVFTAMKTYEGIRIGTKEKYSCPSIALLRPQSGEKLIVTAAKKQGSLELSTADDIEITGKLEWPEDLDPGERIRKNNGIEIDILKEQISTDPYEYAKEPLQIEEIDISNDGMFRITVRPENLIREEIEDDAEEKNIDIKIRIIFKDGTELESEKKTLTLAFSEKQVRIMGDKITVVQLQREHEDDEFDYEHEFEAVVMPDDGESYRFKWDFGDGNEYTQTGKTSRYVHKYIDIEGEDDFLAVVRLYSLEDERFIAEDYVSIRVVDDRSDFSLDTDAETVKWDRFDPPEIDGSWSSLVQGDHSLLLRGRDDGETQLMVTQDGVSWNRVATSFSYPVSNIFWVEDRFFAQNTATGVEYTSSSGESWQQLESGIRETLPGIIAYGRDGFFTVIRSTLYHSLDGVKWERYRYLPEGAVRLRPVTFPSGRNAIKSVGYFDNQYFFLNEEELRYGADLQNLNVVSIKELATSGIRGIRVLDEQILLMLGDRWAFSESGFVNVSDLYADYQFVQDSPIGVIGLSRGEHDVYVHQGGGQWKKIHPGPGGSIRIRNALVVGSRLVLLTRDEVIYSTALE